uniref:Uncharacterized protein n=1 Tax=Euplotes crassus TaxID=5936 RepID=A0A7S3KL39_EUPCR|mmetsp:Transcript_33449/g.32911  ORF Transcript_33449/g.32911 Transcript_33449/m.32911 type:complete len:108 (+) Transcript_33449:260-583(+)
MVLENYHHANIKTNENSLIAINRFPARSASVKHSKRSQKDQSFNQKSSFGCLSTRMINGDVSSVLQQSPELIDHFKKQRRKSKASHTNSVEKEDQRPNVYFYNWPLK